MADSSLYKHHISRILLPEDCRASLVTLRHIFYHAGFHTTFSFCSRDFWWPCSMALPMERYVSHTAIPAPGEAEAVILYSLGASVCVIAHLSLACVGPNFCCEHPLERIGGSLDSRGGVQSSRTQPSVCLGHGRVKMWWKRQAWIPGSKRYTPKH